MPENFTQILKCVAALMVRGLRLGHFTFSLSISGRGTAQIWALIPVTKPESVLQQVDAALVLSYLRVFPSMVPDRAHRVPVLQSKDSFTDDE